MGLHGGVYAAFGKQSEGRVTRKAIIPLGAKAGEIGQYVHPIFAKIFFWSKIEVVCINFRTCVVKIVLVPRASPEEQCELFSPFSDNLGKVEESCELALDGERNWDRCSSARGNWHMQWRTVYM